VLRVHCHGGLGHLFNLNWLILAPSPPAVNG
jgi:hypothetical protein